MRDQVGQIEQNISREKKEKDMIYLREDKGLTRESVSDLVDWFHDVERRGYTVMEVGIGIKLFKLIKFHLDNICEYNLGVYYLWGAPIYIDINLDGYVILVGGVTFDDGLKVVGERMDEDCLKEGF